MSLKPTELDAASTSLDEAVAAAVAEGLRVVDRLTEKVTDVLDACVNRATRARADHGDRSGKEALEGLADLLHKERAEAEARFARQRSRLETFNLVLFGRTGAGKSSLIEALSSGNGAPISQGESDWTTEVRDVRWRACHLVDTPGIAGWGRTVARAELEGRAEAAVADADVVLLCFDTQSQQKGEFTKVAEWVSRYGKPVVAVLNSRNPKWRFPTKVARESLRRRLSRSVHEHMGNIRDELGQVGLPNVPVVAINTKRAAFARTSDPYEGPDAGSRKKQRDEVGPERLLEWSNLPALELLIAEALAKHAEQLRLGMLHEQARGVLTRTLERARIERGSAAIAAQQLERGIADVLRLVGRPTEGDLGKSVAALEKLRGGGFGVSGSSEMLRHARHLLAAGLRTPKAAALRKADRLIESSFDEREDLAPEIFQSEVLDPALAEAESVTRQVGAGLQQYLSQRLALVADDVSADLTAAITAFAGAEGSAGRSGRSVGVGLEAGSGLLSIGSGGVLLLAALTAWNPAGWVLGAVGGASVAVGMAISFVGGWLRRNAAHQRETARSVARSSGRRSVNDTFDKVERLVVEEFNRLLSKAAYEHLADQVDRATALRRVTKAADAAAKDLERAVAAVPKVKDASNVLSDVAKDLQRQRFPGEATADRLLWLGEDWCSEPEGLQETEPQLEPSRRARNESGRPERLTKRVRSLTGKAASRPEPGAGSEWLTQTLAVLDSDDDARTALEPVRSLVESAVPRIVVAGDYSAGKSSFIKRLLVESGVEVPENLEVAAQPKTAAVVPFRWQQRELVDTPGFQSSHADHSASAHQAVVGASVVIVLFNPNLVVGDRKDLLSVLLGDPANGRSGKLSRTFFVINRSDELGVDPQDDPGEYESLCSRKELELAQAIGSLRGPSLGGSGDVTADQILCVASDPYGMVGDRRDVTSSDYDQHRAWDGMDAFHQSFGQMSADIDRNGLDVRLLEGGAVALGDLLARRRERMSTIESEAAQRRHLLLDINACLMGGRALQAAARERLSASFVSFVVGLLDDTAATIEPDARRAKVKRLENWSNDPEAQQIFREWATRAEREQEEWREATAGRIEGRIASAEFVTAFPDTADALDVGHLSPKGGPDLGRLGLTAGQKGAKMVNEMSRDTVTTLAHQVGHKFQPWGATKLTAKLNVAGGAFGVVLGAVEIYGVVRSTQKEGEAEREARDRRARSLKQVREETEAFFDGAGDSDGAGAVIAESLALVETVRDDLAGRLDTALADASTLAGSAERCEQRMRDALERLETGAK